MQTLRGRVEGRAEGEMIGEARGEVIGKAEAANQIALNILNSAISLDLIAQFTGLSLEQVQTLQQQSRENTLESNYIEWASPAPAKSSLLPSKNRIR